jgi:acetolactate synthase-1/2/3 large subunit
MYTLQALWTMAREQLDVTVLLYDNASYAILQGELARVGAAGGGERAGQLLDLGGPALDFVALATGMGVPATRAETTEDLADRLRTALREPGPHLVVAVLRPAG